MEDLDHDERRSKRILVCEYEMVIFIVGSPFILMTISNPGDSGPDWVTLAQYLQTKLTPSPVTFSLVMLLSSSSSVNNNHCLPTSA